MKQLLVGPQYYEELLARTNAGYSLVVSTYNLPVHELHNGPVNQLLSKGEWTIFVGVPNTVDAMIRVWQMAKRFPQVHWRFSMDSHAKYTLAYKDNRAAAWLGSHNLAVSSMIDVSLRLGPAQRAHLEEQHRKAAIAFFTIDRLAWKIEHRAPVSLSVLSDPVM